jgi:hypothetical protein
MFPSVECLRHSSALYQTESIAASRLENFYETPAFLGAFLLGAHPPMFGSHTRRWTNWLRFGYYWLEMNVASPVYEEIIDFIAAGATPEGIIGYRPSADAQQRVAQLLEREKDGACRRTKSRNLTTSSSWNTS